jgi:hypothetical protein
VEPELKEAHYFGGAGAQQDVALVLDTAGAASAVSMTPLVQYDTTCAEEFARLWLPLRGISIKKNYISKLYYPIAITVTQKI